MPGTCGGVYLYVSVFYGNADVGCCVTVSADNSGDQSGVPHSDRMQMNYAPVTYVHSRVILYYSSYIDLRWRRSIHSCAACKVSNSDVRCGAIHHGFCSPVTVPPKLLARERPIKPAHPPTTGKSTQPSPVISHQVAASLVGSPTNTVQLHNTVVQLSNASVQSPTSSAAQLADSSVKSPTNSSIQLQKSETGQLPISTVQLSKSTAQLPNSTQVQLPISTVKLPDSTSKLSNSTVHLPDSSGQLPSTAVITSTPVIHTVVSAKLHRDRGDISPREREITKDYVPQGISKDKEISQKDRKTNSSNHNNIDAASLNNKVREKDLSKSSNVKELRKKPEDRVQSKSECRAPVIIPQFYFPLGQPVPIHQIDSTVQTIKEMLTTLEGGKILKEHLPAVTKACGLPFYWKSLLWTGAGGDKLGHITQTGFLAVWRKLCQTCHDEAAKFVRLLAKPGACHLVAEDFIPLVQDVVDCHPGLSFLQDAPEFHSRYVHTVISRIFYCVNRSWTGRITVPELRRSNFLQTLAIIQDEEDINRITDYFSYEHFYVIYCKFWELDTDHDLFISKEDLSKHNDHAISSRMIERIFSGAVTRGRTQKEGRMSYPDFVCFLISEEDKRHPTSIEYWFRCMDVDGDGVLSMYEMEYFYEEQLQKMEALGIETLPFEDCLCQMLDMVKPRIPGQISLADLKGCKMTPIFFDTFFNLEKYLDHEQRDPFANAKDLDSDEPEMSDWEKYAAEEYEILVAEEGTNDGMTDEITYEDDFEPDDEELQALTEPIHLADPPQKRNRPRAPLVNTEDDIYDFSHQDLGY